MDACEAREIIISRIHKLDPENASRIIRYMSMQNVDEADVIRLALGPDALLLSTANQVKAHLGLSSPKSLHPLSDSFRPSAKLPPKSPRILTPSNEFQYSYISNPSSPAAARPISYTPVLIGPNSKNNANGSNRDSGSPRLHSYGGNELGGDDATRISPTGRSDSLIFPLCEEGSGGCHSPHPHLFHRRRYSGFLSHVEERYRPCKYFARGFCKKGGSCNFRHGGLELGSPSPGLNESLGTGALQQLRSRLVAAGTLNPFANYNNPNENQRYRPRNEVSQVGMGATMASSSQSIYLTFQPECTFKEEDIFDYFSMFGQVQCVSIPIQEKRMYGFITFKSPETVKHILAMGNPHYVCGFRVIAKTYKDTRKAPDKKHFQQQHLNLERGEYSSSLSPSPIDSKESRMLLNRHEALRRQLEHEAELQNAIKLQGRRMENLQLMDLNSQQHSSRFLPSFPAGVLVSSPGQSQLIENVVVSSGHDNNPTVLEELGWRESSKAVEADAENSVLEETESSSYNNISTDNKNRDANDDHPRLP